MEPAGMSEGDLEWLVEVGLHLYHTLGHDELRRILLGCPLPRGEASMYPAFVDEVLHWLEAEERPPSPARSAGQMGPLGEGWGRAGGPASPAGRGGCDHDGLPAPHPRLHRRGDRGGGSAALEVTTA